MTALPQPEFDENFDQDQQDEGALAVMHRAAADFEPVLAVVPTETLEQLMLICRGCRNKAPACTCSMFTPLLTRLT